MNICIVAYGNMTQNTRAETLVKNLLSFEWSAEYIIDSYPTDITV